MRPILFLISLVTLFTASLEAKATPIHYDEAIDGLLRFNAPLTMGVGTNVVEGRGCWIERGFSPCLKVNDFSFEIAEGTQLVGYRFILEDLSVIGPILYWESTSFLQDISTGAILAGPRANWLGGTATHAFTDIVLGPGTYRSLWNMARLGFGGVWDFRIELDVVSTNLVAVAEPQTLALFLICLMGLTGLVVMNKRERVKV
ncbi:hypothetical protein JCM17844_19630 [Iodidimonas gelatinilytica]|uniref:PEP-CTERM protein-sorting domain-containing protein n=1 Tax=Iodidimonas gelatinilytica TaxID=1236966 RepID=A0A5A7N333_9PROT|nr:hypothetical protein [Iodidimonas gelatinilytica]GEQ98326.1 hypothetical protein JCM17844_19630 [Iodidimonas gelatinilytica]GER02095.1 hypothetical protein JCM17845_27180 [Iodidimonas gelatinilytica]